MNIAIPAPDVIGRLERRLLADFAIVAEEWSEFVSDITRWEDDHLLENPTPELLADHKATVERLLALGRLFSQATLHPEFPDRETSDMIAATQAVLKDKLQMWHRPRMARSEADRVLAACFPDEP
jgi:hypothetical protein